MKLPLGARAVDSERLARDLLYAMHPSGLRAYGTSYSPDGRLIVMRIEKNDGSGGFLSALFTIPAAGGTPTQMTAYSDFRPRGMAWVPNAPAHPEMIWRCLSLPSNLG